VDLGDMICRQFLTPQVRSPVTKENKNTNYLQGSPAHGTSACDPLHPVGQHHACVLCNKSIKYAAQGHTNQVQSQGSLCGICGLSSDNGTKSSPCASTFPCRYHPTNATYISLIYRHYMVFASVVIVNKMVHYIIKQQGCEGGTKKH